MDKSYLIAYEDKALYLYGVAAFERLLADANSPTQERISESGTLHEKFGDGPKGKEADWLDTASFSH